MLVSLDGTPPDGVALLKEVEQIFHEEGLVKSGGYIPPDEDPKKCEPIRPSTPDAKGGFEIRVEYGKQEPLDRSNRIACQVRDKCTALVKEDLK